MSQDNFNVLQPEALADECLIAKKIYGRCKQQDCLRPVDYSHPPVPPCPNGVLPPEVPDFIKISSSLFGNPTDSTNSTLANIATGGPLVFAGSTTSISEGTPIAFNSTVASIKISNFATSISTINVASPGQFGLPGFYDVTVQYTFYYNLTFYDASENAFHFLVNNVNTTAVPAYTVYKKQISLEGGVVDPNTSIAIGDSALCPTCNVPQTLNNVPYAYVQAIASPLVPKIGQYPAPGSTTNPPAWAYHADVVIGLFTIIELYRITNMTVASSGPIEVPQCQPSVINDPCVGFNQLLFPYDDFDPPYRKC